MVDILDCFFHLSKKITTPYICFMQLSEFDELYDNKTEEIYMHSKFKIKMSDILVFCGVFLSLTVDLGAKGGLYLLVVVG